MQFHPNGIIRSVAGGGGGRDEDEWTSLFVFMTGATVCCEGSEWWHDCCENSWSDGTRKEDPFITTD